MKKSLTRKIWTIAEKTKFIKLYPYHPTEEIAKMFNCTPSQAYNLANHSGIHKTPELIKKQLQVQADRLRVIGVKSRYPKGNIPLNKGQKMPDHVYEKAKATMFKKGHQVHNEKYNGYERLSKDGYYEIRVAKGKFVTKQRYLWEQSYGKIPKGMIIIYKDNNQLNCVIENLECITREELMKRNTIQRYPAELQEIMKLNKKLIKKLKN